jgi:hypothetical protein
LSPDWRELDCCPTSQNGRELASPTGGRGQGATSPPQIEGNSRKVITTELLFRKKKKKKKVNPKNKNCSL